MHLKGKSITIQTHKDLDAHQVNSQVANLWSGLPAEVVEALAVFERISDTTLTMNGSSTLKVTAVPWLTNHQSQLL